jgi:hypothetical protein
VTYTRVDELVDNWWTTCLTLGVTRPILWMIRAIPQNLEIGARSLLRRRSGSAKNLPRHQRWWPGPEGNQGVSEHQVPGVCESGTRCPGVSGRVYLTGGPSREGAFLGGGHLVDRGAPGFADRWWRVPRIRGPRHRTVGDVELRGPFHLIHGRGLFLTVQYSRRFAATSDDTPTRISPSEWFPNPGS